MTLAFISYSRRDKEFVTELYDIFITAGYEKDDLWVDWQDIPPTADWWNEIKAGIDSADNFLFVVSPDSAISKVCYDEIEYAAETNKRIVPVVWRDVVGEASEQLHSAISAHNWIFAQDNIVDIQEAFTKISDALNQDLDYIRNHTRLLVRAREWEDKERGQGYLLTGQEVSEAETWMSHAFSKEPAIADLHSEYIIASRKRATAQQGRLLVAAGIASILMAFLAVFAGFNWFEAEDARAIAVNEAKISRSLALSANAQLAFNDNNFPLAISIANEATNMDDPPAESIHILDQAAHMPAARAVFREHDELIFTVVMHPSEPLALSAAKDVVIYWNYETLEVIHMMPEPDEDSINSLAMSLDGNFGYSAHNNGNITVWELETGEVFTIFDAPDEGYEARRIIANEDGESIFVAYSQEIETAEGTSTTSYSVRQLDAKTGEEISLITGYGNTIMDMDIQNGILAIVGDSYQGNTCNEDDENCTEPNYNILLWNIEEQALVGELVTNSDANTVAFSPSGQQIAVGLDNNSIKLWDIEGLSEIYAWTAHLGRVNDVRFTPDNNWLISAGEGNLVRVWEVVGINDTPPMLYEFVGHSGPARSLAVSADGEIALSTSSDETIRVLELGNGEELWHLTGHARFSRCADLNADATVAFTCERTSDSHNIFVWDIETGTLLNTLSHNNNIGDLVNIRGTTKILSSARGGQILLWDYETGEIEHELSHPEGGFVRDVAVTSDGLRAISLSSNTTTLWDLTSGEVLHTWALSEDYDIGSVSSLDISFDDKYAGISTYKGLIILLDIETFEVITWEKTSSQDGAIQIFSINFSHTSNRLVTAYSNGTIGIWDIETQDEVLELIGHTLAVDYADFSVDDAYILSGADDETLRLWDAETGVELRRIKLNRIPINLGFISLDLPLVVGTFSPTQFILQLDTFSVPELQEWSTANRVTEPLNCSFREQYQIDASDCD